MIKKIINILPEKWLDRLIKIGYETEDLEVTFGWWNDNDHNCWCDLVFTVGTNEDCTKIDEYSFKYREKYVDDDEWYYDIDETALKCINELTAPLNSLKSPEITTTATSGYVEVSPVSSLNDKIREAETKSIATYYYNVGTQGYERCKAGACGIPEEDLSDPEDF